MKTCSKLIITSLFFLCNMKLSSRADSCSRNSCPSGVNMTVFSAEVTVRYPFRINDLQPKSCGEPGFDFYCDSSFGTVIKLPNNIVLRVEGIGFNPDYITLSDRYDNCLPKKLMSLNLTNTPFGPTGYLKKFWLYNCSGVDSFSYDTINCLGRSNYTVISSEYDIIDDVQSNCSFLTTVIAPTYFNSFSLRYISTIDLTWTGTLAPPLGSPPRYSANYGKSSNLAPAGLILGVLGSVITILFCCCGFLMYRKEIATATNVEPSTMSNATLTTIAGGLDQVTVDSYPVVIVGESGRLIKSDDNICPICLSDYLPGETLKILPECLHRFHAECIDQWLLSKGDCPICRTSPPRHS